MKRFAFKMYLKPGCEKEYAKRHAAIWPELKKMISEDQGVSNYSIFWDKETNLLFAYQECLKDTNSQDTTDVDPITQKWWDMMADIMDTNKDNSPSAYRSRSSSTWTERFPTNNNTRPKGTVRQRIVPFFVRGHVVTMLYIVLPHISG